MLVFGARSVSVFDFLTFYALLYFFGAGAALFQTGWFIESDHNPVLVVFCHRTRRAILREQSRTGSLSAMATRGRRDRGRPSASSAGRWVFGFGGAAVDILHLSDRCYRCLSGSSRNRQRVFFRFATANRSADSRS